MSGGTGQRLGFGPPTSFVEWERALTHRLLMVGPTGDASPIRSFEISQETLAAAVGATGADALEQTMASFTRHVVEAGGLPNALRHGLYPNLSAQGLPGCFAYLVLTLYVVSLRGEGGGYGGDYRRKLREFLGSDRSFMELPGVAMMWGALKRWLSGQRAVDGRFRELVFPDVPKGWVHIGITLKYAFPTKADATLLSAFLEGRPGVIDHPRRLLEQLTPFLDRGRRSEGMVEAFKDFRSAFTSGDRLLADHRFWKLVRACASTERGLPAAPPFVGCSFDEDGQPVFSVDREDGSRVAAGPLTLSDAVSELEGAAGKASSRDHLVFRQLGYGRWRSEDGFEAAGPRVRLGLSQAAFRRLREGRHLFVPSGAWFITQQAIPVGSAEGLVSSQAVPADRLASITVWGGVWTGGVWLGRPTFMPRLDAGGVKLEVRPGSGAAGQLHFAVEGSGSGRLRAAGTVSGTWVVEPIGDKSRSCRQVAFTPNAQPHRESFGGDDVGEQLLDWEGTRRQGGTIRKATPADLGWLLSDGPMSDLVEAVYAGGRRGWDEGDLVGLLGDAFGHAVDPWGMLRILRDATLIQPRLRHRWRGRIWTLRTPELVRIRGGAVVQGAVCEVQADLFRRTSEALGGNPFRSSGAIELSPPLMGHAGTGSEVLAEKMGWKLADGSVCTEAAPMAFGETDLVLTGKEPASRWDWERRTFVADGDLGDGPVGLTRWKQASNRDHDVYQLCFKGRERRLLSRDAALVLAHCLARRPLFSFEGGLVQAQVRGAFLPDALAARLRLSTLANAGIEQGLSRYVATPTEAALLAKLLPSAISGASGPAVWRDADQVASVRHSGGRIRAIWRDGALGVAAAGGLTGRESSNEGA